MSILDYGKDVFVNPDKYAKFWVAVVAAGVQLINVYFSDQAWVPVVVSLIAALGVITVPNKK